MRSLILLLSLCLSLGVFAKKKNDRTPVDNQPVSAKSIENTIVAYHLGSGIDAHDLLLDSPELLTNNDAVYYFTAAHPYSDNFFNASENSYKSSGKTGATFENYPGIREKANQDTQNIFLQGVFYGFVLMLVLLNIACFFLFEEKTYLLYGLSLASMALLWFYSDGLFSLLGLQTSDYLVNNQTLFLFIAVGLSTVFASRYLTLEEHLPKMKFITGGLYLAAAVLMTLGWIYESYGVATLTNLVLFSIISMYFLTGIYLFGAKNYAKFFVIATAIPLLFGIDFFVLNPLGIDFLSTQTTHIKAAAIAEMLILSYAIMYRMQAIKEEHTLRQAEMRIFLKRQEVLTTRRKTEKMVEDVYLENLIMHYDLDGFEIKLLQYISEGKDNVRIARKLKISETEVEERTKELYHKLEIGEQIQQDYRMVESQPDYIYN